MRPPTRRDICRGLAALPFSAGLSAADAARPLTIGLYQSIAGFEIGTVKSMSQATISVSLAVLEGLFAIDFEGNRAPMPRLGTAFELAADGRSAVVHLRRGVRFHDGTPFDADAVAFHYNRILDPALGLGLNTTFLEPLERVDVIDTSTVRFVLKTPWYGLQTALAIDHPMNLIGSPAAIQADAAAFNRHPIGTGPFIFERWISDDHISLSRNVDYWESGKPASDRILFRFIPDENARFQSLRAGDIDIAWIDNPSNVLAAKKSAQLAVHESLDASGFIWMFNHRKPPFDDPRARAAVIHGFNAPSLANGYFQGLAVPSDGFVTSDSPWHCDSDWRSYDPSKAIAILKELDKPVRFTVNGYSSPDGRRLNAILQEYMRSIGVDVTLQVYEPSRIFPLALRGDFELTQFRIADYGGEPDLPFSYIIYKLMGYDNPRMAPMIAAARAEPDPAVRRRRYCDITAMLSNDAVFLYPMHSYSYVITAPSITGLGSTHNHLVRVRTVHRRQS